MAALRLPFVSLGQSTQSVEIIEKDSLQITATGLSKKFQGCSTRANVYTQNNPAVAHQFLQSACLEWIEWKRRSTGL